MPVDLSKKKGQGNKNIGRLIKTQTNRFKHKQRN